MDHLEPHGPILPMIALHRRFTSMSLRPSAGPENEDAADGRSATARAAEWVSRVTTISLEMVLPGLAGYWLDTKLETLPLFLLVGFAVGGYLAFKQLQAIARRTKNRPANEYPEH